MVILSWQEQLISTQQFSKVQNIATAIFKEHQLKPLLMTLISHGEVLIGVLATLFASLFILFWFKAFNTELYFGASLSDSPKITRQIVLTVFCHVYKSRIKYLTFILKFKLFHLLTFKSNIEMFLRLFC